MDKQETQRILSLIVNAPDQVPREDADDLAAYVRQLKHERDRYKEQVSSLEEQLERQGH